jgi:hypothetical protein
MASVEIEPVTGKSEYKGVLAEAAKASLEVLMEHPEATELTPEMTDELRHKLHDVIRSEPAEFKVEDFVPDVPKKEHVVFDEKYVEEIEFTIDPDEESKAEVSEPAQELIDSYCPMADFKTFCYRAQDPKTFKFSKCRCPVPMTYCNHPIDYKAKKRWCVMFDYRPVVIDGMEYPSMIYAKDAVDIYKYFMDLYKSSKMSYQKFVKLFSIKVKS